MANTADRKVIAYVADISDVKAKLKQLQRINTKVSDTIGKDLGTGLKQVGDSLGKISTTDTQRGFNDLANTTHKTSQVMQNLDGSLVKVTKTTKVNSKGVATVSKSYQDLSKNSVSLGENIGRLAKRALITIPTWLLLRGAIMGVFRTIKNGIKTISEQDRALQKAKRNISGTTTSIETDYKTLRKEALALSLETGVSVEKIVSSFQKFATVGFDFETSMEGATSAIKTSILLFGDAEETANAFARSLRVLVDNSDSTKSAGEQISEAMALTAELWKTNAFEINEFTQSLEKFAGTAKTTNITTAETIALLSTLSTAGLRQRGGRLLRTSINKLLGNLDQLAGTLGVKVNPELDTTFTVLIKVINELEKLQQTSGSLGPTTEIIGKIFGGVRGAEVVRALIALRSELNKNLAITGDLNKFNKEFENQNEQINRLSEQYKNLNKETGKAYISVILGGENWQDTLKGIVDYQKKFNEDTGVGITRVEALAHSFNFLKDTALFLPSLLVTLLSFGKIKPVSPLNAIFDIEDTKIKRTNDKINKFGDDIINAMRGKLSKKALTELLTDFSFKVKENNFQIDNKALIKLEGDLRKQLAQMQSNLSDDGSLDIKTVITRADQQDIAKLILESTLAQAKAQGKSEAELLKITDIATKRLGIEEQTIDKLSRQIALEREIANEKRLQAELGNEALTLFRIAQEQGTQVASKIGDVLSGDIDFSTFIRRGGEAVEIFKKEFSSLFEQQQALQFFRGDRVSGSPKLRGGERITIQEQLGKTPFQFATDATLAQKRAETGFTRLETVNQVTAPVNITANIDISKIDEVSNEVITKISDELPKAGTQINNALKNALIGRQSKTL